MEGTLGDPGEDIHHRVTSGNPLLIVHVDEVENLCAVSHKDAAKEQVDEIHLSDDIDKVEDVAHKIPKK